MVIGFVSKADPFHNRVAWSGTYYKLREAIELAGFDVRWIPCGNTLYETLLMFLLKVWNNTLGRKSKWLLELHFRPIAKLRAKELDTNPIVKECDCLFFPCGAQMAPFSKIRMPYIYLSDATASIMKDYYWINYNKKSLEMAFELDEMASQKAFANIRSSQWANDSLTNDYHCDSSKCHVLEFGPNIDINDITPCQPYKGGQLRILFSGVYWNRKGGDVAVEVTELLRDKGIDARLTVAGPDRIPKRCEGKSYIDYVGYLNKNKKDDYKTYLELYAQSHIFLLPTKAECSAIVYSEAAAAGLPCYTYLTGGTGNYVVNGVNGRAIPLEATANDFAEQIIQDIHAGKLPSFREGASRISSERLSWEAWATGFAKIMVKFN